MRGRRHGEVEHRTGGEVTTSTAVNRNRHETVVFEREGKSDATEQGAGVEGCDPTNMHLGEVACT